MDGQTRSTPAETDPGTVGRVAEHMIRVTRAMRRLKTLHAARTGMEQPASILLFILEREGPQRAGTLAEILRADPSTISRQVAHLVERGWIERRPDPADGRAWVLAPTEAGLAALADFRNYRDEHLTRVLADWSDEDVDVLAAVLDRFATDLEAHLPGAAGAHALPTNPRGN